nr:MAG TPA: hypothetical protein [Caudoviricetes sp.]
MAFSDGGAITLRIIKVQIFIPKQRGQHDDFLVREEVLFHIHTGSYGGGY